MKVSTYLIGYQCLGSVVDRSRKMILADGRDRSGLFVCSDPGWADRYLEMGQIPGQLDGEWIGV